MTEWRFSCRTESQIYSVSSHISNIFFSYCFIWSKPPTWMPRLKPLQRYAVHNVPQSLSDLPKSYSEVAGIRWGGEKIKLKPSPWSSARHRAVEVSQPAATENRGEASWAFIHILAPWLIHAAKHQKECFEFQGSSTIASKCQNTINHTCARKEELETIHVLTRSAAGQLEVTTHTRCWGTPRGATDKLRVHSCVIHLLCLVSIHTACCTFSAIISFESVWSYTSKRRRAFLWSRWISFLPPWLLSARLLPWSEDC